MNAIFAGGTVLFWFGLVFGTALLILWIILPFAIFGIKDRIDRLNEALAALTAHVDMVKREISGMRLNQGQEIETLGRIERIQGAAHGVKFEE